MSDAIIEALGIYFGVFVVAIVSAFVPVIPIEGVIGALVIPAVLGHGPPSHYLGEVLAIGVLAAAGQMVGKIVLYLGANRAVKMTGADSKPDGRIAKAKRLLDKWKDKPLLLTFVSALVGIPPFVLVSLVAGMFGIRFRAFVTLGMAGRTIRFVVIGMIALWATHSL